jgi:hypothetical protein
MSNRRNSHRASKPFPHGVFRNGCNGVEIDDTLAQHAASRAEGNLDRNVSNAGCDRHDRDELSNFVGFVTRKEDYRTAAGRRWEFSPPNLAALHSQGSAARPLADAALAASTSLVVSGWFEYPRR